MSTIIERLKQEALKQVSEATSPVQNMGGVRQKKQGLLNSVLTEVAVNSGAISKNDAENSSSNNGNGRQAAPGGENFMEQVVKAMAANNQTTAPKRINSGNGSESAGPLVVVDPKELGKQIIARGGKSGRIAKILEGAMGVGEDYVKSIGTAFGNRAGRLLGADLPPEEYLSEPAREALGLVSQKTLELMSEIGQNQFQSQAREYARQILAVSNGPIVARGYLTGETQLNTDEFRLAKEIAVRVIREGLNKEEQIQALTYEMTQGANRQLAENIFTHAYEEARKAQFGLEIQQQLNPSESNRVPVLRIKPWQLFWSSLLDAEEEAGKTIVPVLTPNEKGRRGIDIEMDVKTGDIYVLRGGAVTDTSVYPAKETRIDWQQADVQSIFSDSKPYRGLRKLLLYRGQNMEVGHIVLRHQKQKRSVGIPIIASFPDSKNYALEKPAESGGYALTLGLAGLKESFAFANQVKNVMAGKEINHDTGIVYAQRVSQDRLVEQRFRPRLIAQNVQELVKKAHEGIEADRQLSAPWQDKVVLWKQQLAILRSLSSKKQFWMKQMTNNAEGLSEAQTRRLEEIYNERFSDRVNQSNDIWEWMNNHSIEYERAKIGLESVSHGIIALLNEASLEQLSAD